MRIHERRNRSGLAALALLLAAGALTAAPAPHDEPEPLHAEPLALMPRGITSFGAAATDGWLYVLGGYFGQPHRYHREGQSPSFARLNLADGKTWEELRGIGGIQSIATAAHGGKVYRVGGMRIRNAYGEEADMHSVTEAAVYDPLDGRWHDLPALPSPVSSHAAAFLGDTLYVFGGWILQGTSDDPEWLTRGFALDVTDEDGQWREIPAPFERRGLAVGAAHGKVYVIGGIRSDRDVSGEVDVYDPATGEWSEGPAFPGEPFGMTAYGVGDTLYASGQDGNLYGLDAQGEWSVRGALAFSRFFHQLVADDEALYALGGIVGMTREPRVRHVERFAFAPHTKTPAVRRWALPFPGDARNRQAVFLRGNSLYFFGGNSSLADHDFEPERFERGGYQLYLSSLTFQRAAQFPRPRQSMRTVVTGDGHFFAVGGFGPAEDGLATHGEAFAYSARNNAWKPVEAGLPRGLSQFALTEHDGALWAFGGLDFDLSRGSGEAFRFQDAVLRADIHEERLSFEPMDEARMPEPRRAFGGALLGDDFYVVGGMRREDEPARTALAFSFADQAWREIAAPGRPRIEAELVALHGRLYLVGGRHLTTAGDARPAETIEVYDPAQDSWSELPSPAPLAGEHLRAFAWQDQLLLVSSHNDHGVVELCLLDVR